MKDIFIVKKDWEYDWADIKEGDTPNKDTKKVFTGYTVQLPHSCDEWVITKDMDKTKAIKETEDFIKEAQESLKRLKLL